jgi:hypothetical protein
MEDSDTDSEDGVGVVDMASVNWVMEDSGMDSEDGVSVGAEVTVDGVGVVVGPVNGAKFSTSTIG